MPGVETQHVRTRSRVRTVANATMSPKAPFGV